MAVGRKFGWHSGTVTALDGRFKGDLYVQDDIVFSDVSAGVLGVTGGIDMSGTTSAIGIEMTGGTYATAGIAIGTGTLDRQTMAEAEDFAIAIYTTCADTDGANTATPLYVNSTYSGAGQVARAAEFVLLPTAQLGGWCNAVKAYTDFSTTAQAGGAAGLISSLCAELRLPNGACTGHFFPIEVEWVGQGSTSFSTVGTGSGSGFITFHAGGTVTDLNSDGVFMSVTGLSAGATSLLSLHSQTLRCDISYGTLRYLVLSQEIDCLSFAYTNNITEVIPITVTSGDTVTTGMSMSGEGTYTTGILFDATVNTTPIQISAGSMADAILIDGATPTDGIHISSICGTTGINIDAQTTTGIDIGACANAIVLSGVNTAYGINISGAQTTGSAINIISTGILSGHLKGISIDYDGVTLGTQSNTGIEVLMHATYGDTGTERAIAASGDGTTVDLCSDDKAAITVGGTVTTGLVLGGTLTTGITMTQPQIAGISIAWTESATDGITMTVATLQEITRGIRLTGAGNYVDGILLDATTFTDGIHISGACTNAINIGIQTTTGINFAGGGSYNPIHIGTKDNVKDQGLVLTGVLDDMGGIMVFCDDGGVDLTNSWSTSPIWTRYLITIDQTSNTATGAYLQLKLHEALDLTSCDYSAVKAYLEITGTGAEAMELTDADLATINVTLEYAGTITNTSGTLAGIKLDINDKETGDIVDNAANSAGIIIMKNGSSTLGWPVGLKINNAGAATGIEIGTCTTGINVTDDSTISQFLTIGSSNTTGALWNGNNEFVMAYVEANAASFGTKTCWKLELDAITGEATTGGRLECFRGHVQGAAHNLTADARAVVGQVTLADSKTYDDAGAADYSGAYGVLGAIYGGLSVTATGNVYPLGSFFYLGNGSSIGGESTMLYMFVLGQTPPESLIRIYNASGSQIDYFLDNPNSAPLGNPGSMPFSGDTVQTGDSTTNSDGSLKVRLGNQVYNIPIFEA